MEISVMRHINGSPMEKRMHVKDLGQNRAPSITLNQSLTTPD